MKVLVKTTIVLSVVAFTLAKCQKNDDEPPPSGIDSFRSSIQGNWQSVSSEFDEDSENYGFRTLNLTASAWSIKVERFADEKRAIPLFALEFEGPYEVTGESAVLPGSYNGTFSFSKKYFTTFIDPANLGLQDCGLKIGIRKDISNDDCGWLESIERCPADYDLITVENNQLLPGKRTPNMCEADGRPIEKGFPLTRF